MNRRMVAKENYGGTELQLWENYVNGRWEYEMIINGVFIMASYNAHSSKLLFRRAIERKKPAEDIRVLIGGLGMGFTVKEACSFPGVNGIDVVEIEPVIMEWNRRYFRDYNGNCLNDRRVRVVPGDFYDYVMRAGQPYDIITMDIDNGPAMLVREGNHRVYSPDFFRRIKEILRPGGIFVIWSCTEEPNLAARLRETFTECQVEQVAENHGGRDWPYYLYLAGLKKG